jgi:hypothetical protein
MSPHASAALEDCVAALQRGELTESRLRSAFASAAGAGGSQPKQELLYLQCYNTSPDSQAIGMMMVRDGQLDQGPADASQWPYQNVLAALADGWRVISFPNLALMTDDRKTFGLGCEFILERWS